MIPPLNCYTPLGLVTLPGNGNFALDEARPNRVLFRKEQRTLGHSAMLRAEAWEGSRA